MRVNVDYLILTAMSVLGIVIIILTGGDLR